MIFTVIIILALVAIGFFHYVQGFLSATISAIISIISAVVAVSYFEMIVEGPLAGVWTSWMPPLVLLGLFALSYVILRTIFDKAVPGQISLPAVVDKIGGAVMGLVAGMFALGVVVLAAHQMPFGPSLAGYVRYETDGARTVYLPPQTAPGGRGKSTVTAETYDEIIGDRFDDEKVKSIFPPVDAMVVSTVAHLSGIGSLNNDKPFSATHPDYVQELFGSRLGIEAGAERVAINSPPKRTDIEVSGVYRSPPITDAIVVDHDFKKLRATAVKPPKLEGDEMRVVVRVKFNPSATSDKDGKVRISPASVRLVARRPDPQGIEPEPQPHNYFPIGTLDPSGRFYANKIDDYLFVDVRPKKLDGTEDGIAEVDFVFQVKSTGFLKAGTEKDAQQTIAEGTFLEVKRSARVDLGGDLSAIKPSMPRLQVIAIRRKRLDWEEGGVAPIQPAGGATGISVSQDGAATVTPTAEPAGGGGELGQRLAGTWETRPSPTVVETWTFTATGGLTLTGGNASITSPDRWLATGTQGETLTIKTAAPGNDLKSGEERIIAFEGPDQFRMNDSSGSGRVFNRVGDAAAAPAIAVDVARSRMIGAWESATGLSYTFRLDGTYTGAQAATGGAAAKSADGTWKVAQVLPGTSIAVVELVPPNGKPVSQRWNVPDEGATEMVRVEPAPPIPFKRKP